MWKNHFYFTIYIYQRGIMLYWSWFYTMVVSENAESGMIEVLWGHSFLYANGTVYRAISRHARRSVILPLRCMLGSSCSSWSFSKSKSFSSVGRKVDIFSREKTEKADEHIDRRGRWRRWFLRKHSTYIFLQQLTNRKEKIKS